MNTQSTPGKIDRTQKQYRDTCIGDAQKHAYEKLFGGTESQNRFKKAPTTSFKF